VERELVEAQPRFRVILRIGNLHGEFHVVMVDPVKRFLHLQSIAVRAAGMIEPASRIQPDGLDHERVVIHPFADGVAVPPRLRVLGEFSPIRPDDAEVSKVLI